MTSAQDLVANIQTALAPVEEQLLRHRYITALEAGTLSRNALRRFAGEQHAIISADLRSVALLVNRFGATASRDFFLVTLAGEKTALDALGQFAAALGMTADGLAAYEPLPGAHAYTAYMAYLAIYGSAAEVAAAYLLNFRAWGESCGRMSRALQQHYGFSKQDVAFFDGFAATAPEFPPAALAVIQDGLDGGVSPRSIQRAARLLQGYELLYWNTLAEAGA